MGDEREDDEMKDEMREMYDGSRGRARGRGVLFLGTLRIHSILRNQPTLLYPSCIIIPLYPSPFPFTRHLDQACILLLHQP